MGSKKYPKEELRVFSGGSVYVMDNYVQLTKYGSSTKTARKWKQDKGIDAEYRYIFNVLKGKSENDNIASALAGHRMLLMAL